MVNVGQLIQNLVWILLSGESMDPLKPFEWYMYMYMYSVHVVQLATNTVQMVSPMGIFESGNFEWFQMVYQ